MWPAIPEFLPWCVGARVEQPFGDRASSPSLEIVRGVLRMQFTTRNTPAARMRKFSWSWCKGRSRRWPGNGASSRSASAARGSLPGRVRVQEPLIAAACNHAFESICDTIVDAFARRAQGKYGCGASAEDLGVACSAESDRSRSKWPMRGPQRRIAGLFRCRRSATIADALAAAAATGYCAGSDRRAAVAYSASRGRESDSARRAIGSRSIAALAVDPKAARRARVKQASPAAVASSPR